MYNEKGVYYDKYSMSNNIIWSRFVGIVKESSIEYPSEIIYVAYNTCTTVYSIISASMCVLIPYCVKNHF